MTTRGMNGMVAVLFVCAMAGTAMGQARDTVERLERMRKTYEAEVVKIDGAAERKRDVLNTRYVASLAALATAMQHAGRLEPLLVVRAEHERFVAARDVAEADARPDVPELHSIQKEYRSATDDRAVVRARQLVELAGKYERSLIALRTRLTKAGDIDSALVVKDAHEALNGRKELTAARFVLADALADAADATPPATEAVVPPEKVKPGDLRARRPVRRESDKRRIGKRYDAFCEALAGDDLDAVVAFIDPRVVAKAGTDVVKPILAAIAIKLKGAKEAGITIEPGRIEVDEEAGTAFNIPRIRIFKEIKDGDPTSWVYVEDEWYVDFGGGKKDGKDE